MDRSCTHGAQPPKQLLPGETVGVRHLFPCGEKTNLPMAGRMALGVERRRETI